MKKDVRGGRITLAAPAKVNLYLGVHTQKDERGYHLVDSVMAALAHIPFLGFSVTGCLAVVMFGGREYRFATYRGVRILDYTSRHVLLRQGAWTLEFDLSPLSAVGELCAPSLGRMSGRIRESCDARLRVRLSSRGSLLLDALSPRATCEVVGGE